MPSSSASRLRLQVSSPTTATNAAKVWEFTSDTGNVKSIDVQLKKDGKRVSVLTAALHDPGMVLFNEFPDATYNNIPVKLYLSRPGAASDVTYLAFDGKVTEFAAGFPGPTRLQIVAHDKSIDARKVARARTFKGMTSVQIAKEIAKVYGWDVDTALGEITVAQTAIDHRPDSTDWRHMVDALSADGLECFFHGPQNKLVIRHKASLAFSTVIRRGDPIVKTLEVRISHIRGPGQGGDIKGRADVETLQNQTRASSGVVTTAQAQENAGQTTHRRPVRGQALSVDGSHAEDARGSPWSNQVDMRRRRKDSATLVTTVLPDLGLHHTLTLAGWGAKVDGAWNIEAIGHRLVSDSAASETSVSLVRKAKSKSAGLDIESAVI